MSSKAYKAVLVLITVLSLVGVSFQQRQLNGLRETMGLTRVKPLENAPPVLAFTTVALGGFRGLIANALWIRATQLQEDGKYFEMVQLADWITKLQPHITTVWYHLAWNMAYNISIKFQTPDDRWPWVLRGIELLRDQGLHYNPKETLLYRELAWFFQHKIGHNLDDAHMFYKQLWGTAFASVLTDGKPDYEGLLNPGTDEERQKSDELRKRFKMDPSVMQEVDKRFGPLEWRLPEAHAIYWAFVGQRYGKKEEQVTLRRAIYQSMQLAFARGALLVNKVDKTYSLGPNLDIIPNASASYEEMMAQEPENASLHQTGHKNFLKKAVYHLYTFNRKRDSEKWFAYLKKTYPGSVPDTQTLDEYAVEQVTEDATETNMDETTAVIRGLLVNSFMDLAQDEDERAANYVLMAQRIWNRYTKEVVKSKDRVGLKPFVVLRQEVLDYVLDPSEGFSEAMSAALRSKLGIPAPVQAPPAEAGSDPSVPGEPPARSGGAPAGRAPSPTPPQPRP